MDQIDARTREWLNSLEAENLCDGSDRLMDDGFEKLGSI